MEQKIDLLSEMKSKYSASSAGKRILSELEYAFAFSASEGNTFDAEINLTLEELNKAAIHKGAILEEDALKAESNLKNLASAIKNTTIICLGHAHIDLDWLWGYDETVSSALATFRTMLNLMKEFPDFVFAQSQAALYEIVNKYDPEMLQEIKERVKEGRWEVTAASFVESDDNMPSGEGLARQIMYGKKDLARLLDISPASLDLYFVPDTFGHAETLPTILAASGIRYMYHCRGKNVPDLYSFKSRSASEVLTLREPAWYNSEINPESLLIYPALMTKYGLNAFIKLYGVGDHGGGATRRDLENMKEMDKWPLYPHIQGGTLHKFFSLVEKSQTHLETITGEINKIFPGCYTSQSALKEANARGEKDLFEAEMLSAMDFVNGKKPIRKDLLDEAWRIHLFNHFHDILPGSCIHPSKEYALGQSQIRNADLSLIKTSSLSHLASNIHLEGDFSSDRNSVSQGAGVGFMSKEGLMGAESSSGPNRAFLLFNPSGMEGERVCKVQLWDYFYPLDCLTAEDGTGHKLPFEILGSQQDYFGHRFYEVAIEASFKAYGYKTVILKQGKKGASSYSQAGPGWWREEEKRNFVLENSALKATFSPVSGALIALFDKKSQKLLDASQGFSAFFQTEAESGDDKRMSAWIMSPSATTVSLTTNVQVESESYKPSGIVKRLTSNVSFGSSKLAFTYSLNGEDAFLTLDCRVDFNEKGISGQSVPSLRYVIKGAGSDEGIYKIPFGFITRKAEDGDVCSHGLMVSGEENNLFGLWAQGKYGFRLFNKEMSVNLLRATSDPDPYPETGVHEIRLRLGILPKGTKTSDFSLAPIFQNSEVLSLPFLPSQDAKGDSEGSLFDMGGSLTLSSYKVSEDGKGIVLRFYETEGKKGNEVVRLPFIPKAAYLCDLEENIKEFLTVKDNLINISYEPYNIISVYIQKD